MPDGQQSGFSFTNLLILVVIAVVVVPLYLKLRERISRDRRERWAREEQEYRDTVERRDDAP